MSILHSTTDPTLLNRLRQMLGSSERADIAVGYFFISGFDQVAAEFAKLKKVRVLVGRTDRQVLEEVARGLQQAPALKRRLDDEWTIRRRERSEVARQAVDHIAEGVAQLPQEQSTEAAVKQLRDLVADGLIEVRTYVRSPLHAKAYLCWYEEDHAEKGAAVVGSSNLTLAGFEGNTELNVRVTGDDEMDTLKDWFDNLWQDSVDIGEELVQELNRSWAIQQTPPYLVYLKALYELFHSDAGLAELATPVRDQQLANFQIDAVRQGLAMIEAHGGCYIGDVVGLGKTFVGAELLRQLSFTYPHDGPPVILCPAGLKPMWELFNERFGLGAAVVSHSMIAPAGTPEYVEELGRYIDADPPGRGIVLQDRFANRGPVLVDEAHNFRNVNQRSTGLQQYLDAGDHKVVLMSATPQNLGPMDIYRQLRLFLDDRNHGLPIEPVSLEAYFGLAQQWLDYERYNAEFWEHRRRPNETTAPKPSKEPSGPPVKVEGVLTHVFIRRRRHDIRDLYGESAEINGEPIQFPKPRLESISYRLDRVYARAGSFEDITTKLKEHKASRYQASEYLWPAAREKDRYAGLLRSSDRVAGLMKVLLLKRLESSVAAFRSTLESLMRSNRHFRQALEAGFVPVGSLATRLINGHEFDADEAFEILDQEDEQRASRDAAHPVEDFRVGDWIQDLDTDYDLLKSIRDRAQSVTPEDDDKLSALRRFLDRAEVSTSKVLIFSEAETTIDYLYEQLNPGGRNPEIERLTGSNRERAESIVGRFSPRSNLPPERRERLDEIRVLLATDVVSEGQNLQDCARVLNYDLHWNPVRLIQRFGRVDRIGTEHDVIHLQSMWPDFEVDQDLDLTNRLTRRIQLFHDLIGLDNRLLSESEQLNTEAMYRIYGDQQLPDSDDGFDDVSVHQRAVATLQRIREEQPELWDTIEGLPDGIRSALVARPSAHSQALGDGEPSEEMSTNEGSQPSLLSEEDLRSTHHSAFDEPVPGETLVLLAAGEIDSCYAVGEDLEPRPISPAQFIAHTECEEQTPAAPLPVGTNERVMAAFGRFSSEIGQRLGHSRRPRNTRARRFVSKQLNLLRLDARDTASDVRRIDELRQIFGGPLPARAEAAVSEVQAIQPQGQALLARLEAICESYRLSVGGDVVEVEPSRPEVIRTVCSDGLVD
ncbi:MAG: hypothetical protein F4Z38_07975 [Chloroflexi bacterium]|nr:hypothetical protein [Chloroflexota bacterium]